MKPSITLIATGLFIAYILHSIYSLITIFSTPKCIQGPCLKSYLNTKPAMELMIFLTERAKSTDGKLILEVNEFDYDTYQEREIIIDIPLSARANGSLYLHTVTFPQRQQTTSRLSLNKAKRMTDASYTINRLTQYAVPQGNAFNLLADKTVVEQSGNPMTHLKTKFAIIMLTDELSLPRYGIPNELMQHLQINSKGQFLPILQQDFLQTRIKDLKMIENDTLSSSFTFIFNPTTFGKLRFLLQMEAALAQLMTLGFSMKDLDEIKGVFADMNLYLLCATVSIGSVHLLFDFLSFKSDVNFWRSHRSMAGLSSRTVLWRAFSQAIVFLYLLDESTSLLVLVPTGIGTLIEFWKVKKVFKVTLSWNRGLPRFKLNKNRTESDAEAKTRQYDEECMRYLSYLLYPLCVIAAFYSLLYQPHKSWYSWTISSMVNGVYAFGFLFMLPQLFVNYRLKSVAALPWRAFTYRAFNTFIDDIFAFIITMPTAHRVACFRDDIVFIIYLYQRWLYPVDKSRMEDSEEGSAVVINDENDKKTQ